MKVRILQEIHRLHLRLFLQVSDLVIMKGFSSCGAPSEYF